MSQTGQQAKQEMLEAANQEASDRCPGSFANSHVHTNVPLGISFRTVIATRPTGPRRFCTAKNRSCQAANLRVVLVAAIVAQSTLGAGRCGKATSARRALVLTCSETFPCRRQCFRVSDCSTDFLLGEARDLDTPVSASATSKIGWRRRSGASWRRPGNERASAGSGGIGRGCTTLSGCSTAIECDATD